MPGFWQGRRKCGLKRIKLSRHSVMKNNPTVLCCGVCWTDWCLFLLHYSLMNGSDSGVNIKSMASRQKWHRRRHDIYSPRRMFFSKLTKSLLTVMYNMKFEAHEMRLLKKLIADIFYKICLSFFGVSWFGFRECCLRGVCFLCFGDAEFPVHSPEIIFKSHSVGGTRTSPFFLRSCFHSGKPRLILRILEVVL